MPASLYFHIPFCQSKCSYCSFSSFPGMREYYARYIKAVKTELKLLAETQAKKQKPLQTIFFGGGTPSIIPAKDLVSLINLSSSIYGFVSDAEISLEANPGTVDHKRLGILREGGFNRLSIGVQSFSANDLALLGRKHTPQEATEAFKVAREVGFTNISLDLMYGLPGQTVTSWRSSLHQALQLEPDHLSMYQLSIEEGTPFAKMSDAGALDLPDDDAILRMDDLNMRTCSRAGLEMYEISNFATKGNECRHNINYWLNKSYMAVGAGAVSYTDGLRERRVADPKVYCDKVESGQSVIIESERLDQDASFRETVVMGLRMTEGVCRERLQRLYGVDLEEYYGDVLIKLERQQLIVLTDSHLRLTPKGRLFSNPIMAELV